MALGETILACLTGFIGLRSCENEEPGSDLFINDLPGISSDLIQVITEAEEETYINEWDKIQREGILVFRTQLMSQVNQCFQINKMETVECLACENKELLATSLWYLLGNRVMIWALSSWNNSKFSTVDRRSVEEIRDHYFDQFKIELKAAVQGFDIDKSVCINHERCCVVPNGKIHTGWSLM